MVEMIWKEPPPAISSEKAAILAELRHHPGKWALVQQGRSSSGAAAPWQKLGCEAKAARNNPGETPPKYDVYARWPELKRMSAGGVNPVPPRPAVGGGTYDPGAGRAARGIPADGLPVESLRR